MTVRPLEDAYEDGVGTDVGAACEDDGVESDGLTTWVIIGAGDLPICMNVRDSMSVLYFS
jgi:hypothetical protein